MRRVALLLLLVLVAAGCGKSASLAGRWQMEGQDVVLAVSEDGTFRLETPDPARNRCIAAGYAEAVEQCASGTWKATGDGFLLGLPGLDISESKPVEPNTAGGAPAAPEVTCACSGIKTFPARLDGDALVLDIRSAGGPEVRLRRLAP